MNLGNYYVVIGASWCPHCVSAMEILSSKPHVSIKEENRENLAIIFSKLNSFMPKPTCTVPQIFLIEGVLPSEEHFSVDELVSILNSGVKYEYVGGYRDLLARDLSGDSCDPSC